MLLILLAAWGAPLPAAAQESARGARRWSEAAAGSELERYLRLAQLAGLAPLSPWSTRAFAPHELDARIPRHDAGHPWRAEFRTIPDRDWWIVRPNAQLIVNTGLPWGSNDGPMWAAKGMTVRQSGGVAVRRGAFAAQVAPDFWWTQNADYALLPAVDAAHPHTDFASSGIDLPQRHGNGAVGRLDPGESWVRMDLFGVAAGISTASEWWGPTQAAGPILSPNGGGLPRAFVGSSAPTDIWIGRAHGRVFVGRAMRSAVSTDTLSNRGRRLAMGVVGSFSPRGVPQLELGFSRFYHRAWRSGGPSINDISVLWEPLFKKNLPGKDDALVTAPDNQLASLSARLTLPNAGLELYTEYAREDHAFDKLDLINEPDHDSAIIFGWQKLLRRDDARWWAVRAEVVNARVTHLVRIRPQVLFYSHHQLRDGHTQRGQLLGAPMVRGGSGAELSVSRYDARGRLSFQWQRQGLARSAEGGLGYGALHALEVSGLRYAPRGDLSWRAGVVQRVGDIAARDLTSLHAAVGWHWAR
ncbi:MAG: capsule assembly Wzi family protein [Gemmatimonadaceae bacterium]